MKPYTFTKIIALILIACAAATLSSCSKNKDTLAVTSENLVGTYRISTITAKDNTSEDDYTEAYFDQACEIDDEYTLKANGTLDRFDAGTTCTPSTSTTGDTWVLLNNKTLAFDMFYGDVVKLTSTEMVVQLVMSSGNQSVTVNFNFIRK